MYLQGPVALLPLSLLDTKSLFSTTLRVPLYRIVTLDVLTDGSAKHTLPTTTFVSYIILINILIMFSTNNFFIEIRFLDPPSLTLSLSLFSLSITLFLYLTLSLSLCCFLPPPSFSLSFSHSLDYRRTLIVWPSGPFDSAKNSKITLLEIDSEQIQPFDSTKNSVFFFVPFHDDGSINILVRHQKSETCREGRV